MEENDHIGQVDAWMARVANGLPPEELIRALEQGFAVLWRRAHQTLGSVTLTAIAGRVLYNVAERYPGLSVLKIEASGLDGQQLRENAGTWEPDELTGGIRSVLIEFLTALGHLTADILTPSLHAELSGSVTGNTDPERRDP